MSCATSASSRFVAAFWSSMATVLPMRGGALPAEPPFLPPELDESAWQAERRGYARPDARTVALLVSQLDATDRRIRARAVWTLGEIGQQSYLPGILARLCDDSALVRQEACRALGRLGSHRAAHALCGRCGDEASDVRRAAVWALSQLQGSDALAALIGRLRGDAVAGVRLEAVRGLREMGGKPSEGALAAALEDQSPRVALAAIRALGALQVRDAAERLSAFLAAPDPRFRRGAASALGQLGQRESAKQLAEATTDPDSLVRKAALGALLSVDQPLGIKRAIELTRDPDPSVRRAAAESLSAAAIEQVEQVLWLRLTDSSRRVRHVARRSLVAAGGKTVASRFMAAINSPDKFVRRECVWALADLNHGPAIPHLIQTLADEDAQTKQGAVIALGRLKAKRASSSLSAMLLRADAELRVAICWSLGEIADPGVLECLLDRLDDGDQSVKLHAIAALGKIGEDRASPSILRLLYGPGRGHVLAEGYEVRAAACWTLGRIRDPRAVERLREFVLDKVVVDPGPPPFFMFDRAIVRGNALGALATIEGERQIGTLRKALEDEDSEALRRTAAELLGTLTGQAHIYRKDPKTQRRYFLRSL